MPRILLLAIAVLTIPAAVPNADRSTTTNATNPITPTAKSCSQSCE